MSHVEYFYFRGKNRFFGLQQILLAVAGDRAEAKFSKTGLGGHPALWRAVEVALEDEVRLVNFLKRVRLLTNGNRE